MADVERTASLREQIALVAGLRWRILRNGLRRKGNVADLIGMLFLSVAAAGLIVAPSFAFYFAGKEFVTEGRLRWLPIPFWGIFIVWQLFPFFTVSFGSGFQFRTLLRFPMKPGAFYLLGLAYGLADFPAVASLCWLLMFTAGAARNVPGIAPILLAVVLLFIAMNVTMERLISSWMERFLAKRRTREIFFGLFILTMFTLQFISPMQRAYGGKMNVSVLLTAMKYLAPFPPSLAARAISGTVLHNPLNAGLGVAGLGAFVALFSVLLWQRFMMQYRGEELSDGPAPQSKAVVRGRAAVVAQAVPRAAGVELQAANFFGFLSPAVGAMMRKELLYLMRNGFGFLMLVLPPAQILFFSTQFAGKRPTFGGKGFSAESFFPAMMAYTILVLMGPAYNAFAYEGRGIQTYFMTPLRFRDVFIGKNLVSATVIAMEVALCASVLAWRIGWPSLPVLCATFAGLLFTIGGQLPVANWSSLAFPRKLEFGMMRNQRNSGAAVWMMLGMQILMGLISGTVLAMGKWLNSPWLPVEAFVFLAAVAFGGYFASLEPLSELAEKKKEGLIEALCR